MEEGSVQLAAKQEASCFFPSEGRLVVPAIPGKGFEIPGRVGKFKDIRKENRELRTEREILKKAAAFFAKHQA